MRKMAFAILICVQIIVSACLPVVASTVVASDAPVVLTYEEVLQLRNERVIVAAERLSMNLDLWKTTPQPCLMSMAKIWVVTNPEGTGANFGSANLIESQKVTRKDGEVAWIYWLTTADHVVRGKDDQVLAWDVFIFPGNSGQKFRSEFLDYTQVVEDGVIQDSGLLTVIRFGDWAEIKNVSFVPLGLDRVKKFRLSWDREFFTFDYPTVAIEAQFVESRFLATVKLSDGNVQQAMKPFDNSSSTVSHGSSGGAVCNGDGHHVGVVSGYIPSWPYDFLMEGNPSTIEAQLQEAMDKSMEALKGTGFLIEK